MGSTDCRGNLQKFIHTYTNNHRYTDTQSATNPVALYLQLISNRSVPCRLLLA